MELSPPFVRKEKISEIELSTKSKTPHYKSNSQMHIGENIYILWGLLCVKCLETWTSVYSTFEKISMIMSKMDKLPFKLG